MSIYFLVYFLFPAIVSFAVLYLLVVLYEDRHHDLFQMMIVILIAITNLGYLAIAVSNNLETALLANKIAYVGGSWIPFCIVLTISKLCGVKLSPLLEGCLASLNLIVFVMSMSPGFSNLFYEFAYIKNVHGITVLKTVYAPMHNLFYVMLVSETLFAFAIVIYAYAVKHKSVPYKSLLLTFFAMLAPRAVYLIRLVFSFDMTLMPILYAISSVLFLLSYSQVNLHDVALIIASANGHSNDHGYIAFDIKKRLVSFNAQAANFFPVLLKSKIDGEVDKDTTLYSQIVSNLDTPSAFYDEICINGDTFLKVNILPPKRKKSVFSHSHYLVELTYLVELVDNTYEHNYIALQKDFNSTLQKEVERQIEHVKVVYDSVIASMSLIIANRDDNTGGHVERSEKCIKIFMQALMNSPKFNISHSFCRNVEKAAILHDIGKIGVDDSILRKPGRFTDDEYDLMKAHPSRGAEIISQILSETDDTDFRRVAVNMAHYHHERWDGKGYPCGLSGEDIPLEARIMALVDVFDALVSSRAYKEAYPYDRAFDIIEKDIGTQFDPELGKFFLSIKPDLIDLYSNIESHKEGDKYDF